jgi:hypothetical protein
MMLAKRSHAVVAAALGFTAVAGLLAASGGGCGDAPIASRAYDGEDAATDAKDAMAALDATDATDVVPDAAASCPDDFYSVPKGWHYTPCECDVVIAPDQAHMHAASPWADCGPGCLELVDDWADQGHRILGFAGSSANGKRYIVYERDLGRVAGSDGPRETQLVDLSTNQVIFDALTPPIEHSTCSIKLDTIAEGKALFEIFEPLPDHVMAKRFVYDLTIGESEPNLTYQHTDALSPALESVITSTFWAATYSRYELVWHDFSLKNEMQVGWTSNDGRLLDFMQGSGSSVFFSRINWPGADIMVWDTDGGARSLIPYASPDAGAACGLTTDGKTMVWFQGQGLDVQTGTYTDVRLMASPYATQPADVKPRVLRQAFHDTVNIGGGIMGGGYVMHYEEKAGDPVYEVILTRLSDGAYWVLQGLPDHPLGSPLYVDSEEFAITENTSTPLFVDSGLVAGETWSILRRTIASLGPPTMPMVADAGSAD